jgi:hypothetical protein
MTKKYVDKKSSIKYRFIIDLRFTLVDIDEGQKPSYGRPIVVVYCKVSSSESEYETIMEYWQNLNEYLFKAGYANILVQYCERSEERMSEWALAGCSSSSEENIANSNNSSSSTALETEISSTNNSNVSLKEEVIPRFFQSPKYSVSSNSSSDRSLTYSNTTAEDLLLPHPSNLIMRHRYQY